MPALLEPPPAAELVPHEVVDDDPYEIDPEVLEDPLDAIDRALEGNQALEYVDGHFEEKTVSELSSFLGAEFVTDLNIAARKPGGGRLARVYPNDLTYRCWPAEPKRSRRPDASVIRLDRLAGLKPKLGEMPIVPDLAVEVISKNEFVVEHMRKLRDYRDAGFPLIWVVYPEEVMVDVITGTEVRRLGADDELTLPDLLPAFRHRIGDLVDVASPPS